MILSNFLCNINDPLRGFTRGAFSIFTADCQNLKPSFIKHGPEQVLRISALAELFDRAPVKSAFHLNKEVKVDLYNILLKKGVLPDTGDAGFIIEKSVVGKYFAVFVRSVHVKQEKSAGICKK